MTDDPYAPTARGRLNGATVLIASVNGQPVEASSRVTGICQVLARLVDPATREPVGYVVAGYNREDGRRYVGQVALCDLEMVGGEVPEGVGQGAGDGS